MPRPKVPSAGEYSKDANLWHQLASIRAELQSLVKGQEGITASQLDIQDSLHKLTGSMASGPNLCFDGPRKFDSASMGEHSRQMVDANDRSSFAKEGRLSFVAGQKTLEERKKQTLKRMFQVAEAVEEEKMQQDADQKNYWTYQRSRVSSATRKDVEMWVDVVVGVAIFANALLIGIGMDYQDESPVWLIIDLTFSAIFMFELAFKLWIHGLAGQFCGSGAMSNCFDAVLILLDLSQVVIEMCFPATAKELDSAPSASLFRIIRLLRLSRLLRALKSDVFKSLSEMVHGIAAGMSTLAWSCVLFLLFVYVVALVLRESLGRRQSENVFELFDSVPRSIYTTFRCSFGDCNSARGVPIFEYVLAEYGAACILFWSLATFIISVVLFNVISAMFVESTMAAAATLGMEKRRARMQNERLLFSKVAFLIRRIMELSPNLEPPKKLSNSVPEVVKAEVPLSVIDEAIQDPTVKTVLNELDINPIDHARLADIFDPDNGGTVELADVATGIRRLRGEPRRSDIVCIELMVRAMQPVVAEILEVVSDIKRARQT